MVLMFEIETHYRLIDELINILDGYSCCAEK